MQPEERQLNLGDDEVLIVACFGNDRRAIGIARQVWRHAVGGCADQEPVAVIELWTLLQSAAVHRVEVERERTAVNETLDVNGVGWRRLSVEGQIVVDELAKVGVAGGCPLGIFGRSLPQHGLREVDQLLVREPVEGLEDARVF